MHVRLLLLLCLSTVVVDSAAGRDDDRRDVALRSQSVAANQSLMLPELPSGNSLSTAVIPANGGDLAESANARVPGALGEPAGIEASSGEVSAGAGACAPPGQAAGACRGLGCFGHDPITHTRCRAAWNLSPGDMYPWAPYFPEYHGDYYFRPYHWTQVFEQQRIAARWGADPRMPYASNVFQTVYAELGIPEASGLERLPPPHGARKRPCDHFESVECDYSR